MMESATIEPNDLKMTRDDDYYGYCRGFSK